MDVSKLILRDGFMKSYAALLKTYEGWSLTFMDKDEMATAGFYFTGYGVILRCTFYKVICGFWKCGDIVFVRCGCGYRHY
jgi:hypothetical protein